MTRFKSNTVFVAVFAMLLLFISGGAEGFNGPCDNVSFSVSINGPSAIAIRAGQKCVISVTVSNYGSFSDSWSVSGEGSLRGVATFACEYTAPNTVGSDSVTYTYTQDGCTVSDTVTINVVNYTVSITSPSYDDQFTMSATGERLTVFTAADSGENNNNLTWSFTGFVFPDGNQGRWVIVDTPSVWPESNSFWGRKYVTLDYSGVIGPDFKQVKIFYEPLAVVQDSRAWYVYLSQGAVTELVNFEPVPNDYDGMEDAYAYYQYYLGYCGEYYTYPYDEQFLINEDIYLDLAALGDTIGHEYKHYECMHDIYDENIRIRQEYLANNITLAEAVEQWSAVDSDDDNVLDSYDPNIGNDDYEDVATDYGFYHWLDYIDNLSKDWSVWRYNYENN